MDNERRALPEGWEWKKLGDVADYINGRAFKPSEWTDCGKPIIRIQNLTNESNSFNYFDGKCEQEYCIKNRDILISWSASLGVFVWNRGEAVLNQHIFKAIPNEEIIDRRFFVFVIRTVMEDMERKTHGSTMKHIVKSEFNKIKIPLPPLPTQHRIVSILEKAEETKRLRAQADELTDRLLQSVFLEMFGDPVRNPKEWKKVPFNKVCQTRLGKMLDKKKQTGHHSKPYLRNANVQWGKIDLSSVFEMDFDKAECAEFLLRKGDILICEGGEIGRTAIWNNELPECYFQKALHRARPFQNSATPEFIVNLMLILGKCNGFGNFTSQSTIAHLTGVKLNLFPIILPPLPLLQKFARVVEKVESMRQSQSQSKQQIEDLFSALMQKAFQGEI
jgi:type I restriction enzyme S subunit